MGYTKKSFAVHLKSKLSRHSIFLLFSLFCCILVLDLVLVKGQQSPEQVNLELDSKIQL